MNKLLATALVAGLAFTSAAPAHAGFWSSVTNYFTQSAPYAATRIDYQGPMPRPASVGGVGFKAYPAQTESAISWARSNKKPIDYIQGPNGTVSKVIINGTTYPGVRLYYTSGIVVPQGGSIPDSENCCEAPTHGDD